MLGKQGFAYNNTEGELTGRLSLFFLKRR